MLEVTLQDLADGVAVRGVQHITVPMKGGSRMVVRVPEGTALEAMNSGEAKVELTPLLTWMLWRLWFDEKVMLGMFRGAMISFLIAIAAQM